MKLLFLGALGNPSCTSWIHGLVSLGYDVVVASISGKTHTAETLDKYGLRSSVPVINGWKMTRGGLERAVIGHFGVQPDFVFGWWGTPALESLRIAAEAFPLAAVALCINCYPDTSMWITEWQERLLQNKMSKFIDGYMFYSQAMKAAFCNQINSAASKPSLSLVEPFLEESFNTGAKNGRDVVLMRRGSEPHVIFTGRADRMWTSDIRSKKDSVGQTLAELANRGVHVFVNGDADLRGISNLHHYPYFSNKDLLTGRFSSYVSQFDAHLVFYNEHNATIKRRVSSGLSTRFALALTAVSPIVVTRSSVFIEEYEQNGPIAASFRDADELHQIVCDNKLLQQLRANLANANRSFSFESQMKRVCEFVEMVGTRKRAKLAP